jgi:hypothetical protein
MLMIPKTVKIWGILLLLSMRKFGDFTASMKAGECPCFYPVGEQEVRGEKEEYNLLQLRPKELGRPRRITLTLPGSFFRISRILSVEDNPIHARSHGIAR